MINTKSLMNVKPPKQPGNLLNKSGINNNHKPSGPIPHIDIAFSFDNKENNQSLNLDEFSPSRVTDGGIERR